VQGDAELRAQGPPDLPSPAPTLAELRARVDDGPAVQRDRAQARAAEARADYERALVRPALTMDVGFDAWDPTLCPGTATCSNPPVNYRGVLSVDVPILNQRGPYIDREMAGAASARARASADGEILEAALTAAYRTFEAWTASASALREGVVPAAEAAASATEESYSLGRATLVAVLDAERSRIDAKLSLIDARAQQADAWVEVEHAAGLE
ncbi:MAG: TolC family protein, partial [Polyangiaceae bacterium]